MAEIAIDLGTSSVLVYIKGKGIVLSEPSIAAINRNTGEFLSVGEEAHRMLGRTPDNIIAIRPLRDGVISDYDITQKMLKYFICKAVGRSFSFKPRIAVCVPLSATGVERRAVEDAIRQAGARTESIIAEPIAAAIGAGIDIARTPGDMVVSIGAGKTDIAVISSGRIAAGTTLRFAGDNFDEAIIRYLRKKHNVLVDDLTAEKLKINIGTVYGRSISKDMDVYGRNLITGLPKSIKVSSEELQEALYNPITRIIENIIMILEKTPPELTANIAERGIVMTGGGSLLNGWDKLIREKTGINAIIAEDTVSCAAIGLGKCTEYVSSGKLNIKNLSGRNVERSDIDLSSYKIKKKDFNRKITVMTGIAIDLGTASILVYIKGKGIALSEPSIATIEKNTSTIVVGENARNLLNRTPDNIIEIRPLRAGVISNYDLTVKMLKYFINKAVGHLLLKPRIAVCVPSSVTEVELRAVKDAAREAGARDVFVIEEPIAAALGAGIDVARGSGNMVVNIGSGATYIAVIALGGVVVSTAMRLAGDNFDESIIRYIRNKHNVMVDKQTAEQLKINIGTAYGHSISKDMNVHGQSLINGLHETIKVTSEEMKEALHEPITAIIESIKMVFDKTPPRLVADIAANGIVMTGGSSLLHGWDKLIIKETGVNAIIAKDAVFCTAIGTGKYLEFLSGKSISF